MYLYPLYDGGRYHIETSPLIRGANQWTGFYMITASVLKGLKTTDDHEEFISINEIDKIINNLDWMLKVLIESTIN